MKKQTTDKNKNNKQKHQFTGYPGDCSSQQQKSLQQFRKFVIQLNSNKVNPDWDDYYLLRFLRARKFDMQKTQLMWTNFIKWRKDNQIDIAQDFYLPQLPQVRKLYPHGYHKVDKKYRPIYIEKIGLVDPEEVFKVTTPDRMIKYYASSYQTLIHKIFDACTQMKKRQTGEEGRVMHSCTILDLKDIKLTRASRSYDFIKLASSVAQDNYPQILGNMFIINAPFLFTGIWAIVSKWVDPKTRQKIQIIGSDYSKQLLKYIDPQNLPAFLKGGQCQCQGGCLGTNPGPWNPHNGQLFQRMLTKQKKLNNESKAHQQKLLKIKQLEKHQQTNLMKKQQSPIQKYQQQSSKKKDTRSLHQRGLACSKGIPFTGKVFIPNLTNIHLMKKKDSLK